MRALLREWPLKLGAASVLAVVYCAGYLFIERHLPRPPVQFSLSPIDRWIRFSPAWVWVYQSIYLLLPLPSLATTRDEVRRFVIGFCLIMVLAFSCFVVLPVRCPRTVSADPGGMYGLLISYDLPFNTFPSLHLAVATYSACVAIRVTKNRLHQTLKMLLPAWVLLIGYSALATKQHYAVDLPAGIVLGWIAYQAAWWR